MLRFALLFMLTIKSNSSFSQTSVKGNVTTIIGYPNLGSEIILDNNITFQIDLFASLWKSINNGPHEILILFPEVRYYTRNSAEGFYVGDHIGGTKYKLKKWNYFDTDYYQQGYSILYGATIGYQLKISNRTNFDFFIGGGNQQGFYKSFDSFGIRSDNAEKNNKSGEWLVYRGGVMFSYKFT